MDRFGAYICGEREFRLLNEGVDGPQPVGFPIEDVFEYDPDTAILIEQGQTLEWGRLSGLAVAL